MTLEIPTNLLPRDGRFGAGPSKVRAEQLQAIVASGSPMGTSHRKPAVKDIVASIRDGITKLYGLPEGYEVLLGNGGASAVWDMIPFCLVEENAQCAVIGEFSGKAARAVERAPWLPEPQIRRVEPGGMIECESAPATAEEPAVDTYIYAHNETSTGALTPLRRFGDSEALTIVDGTSAAGGVLVDPSNVDFYYFSPQKNFASDGGLWLAFASPAAIERIEHLTSERWVPDFLNLKIALDNSRKDQTLNTPALATLIMLDNQVQWMLANGGLAAMDERARTSSDLVYAWAEALPDATTFIADPAFRSSVVTTIDFEYTVDTAAVTRELRANGIVDIEAYRSLGRNQFRIATFAAVDSEDIAKLLSCIDWVIDNI